MSMEVVWGYPPNYAKIKAALNPGPKAMYCYGSLIYVPGGGDVTPAIKAHEDVHRIQQGIDIEGWWDQYIIDPAFRLAMEIPAHQREWEYFSEHGGNRHERRRMIKLISQRLSGKLYGNLVNFKDAKNLIEHPLKKVAC